MCCQIGFSGRMRVFGGLMHAKTYETRKKQEVRGDCSRIERTLMEAGENSCDTLHYPPASTRRLMKRITCHQNGQKVTHTTTGAGHMLRSNFTIRLHSGMSVACAVKSRQVSPPGIKKARTSGQKFTCYAHIQRSLNTRYERSMCCQIGQKRCSGMKKPRKTGVSGSCAMLTIHLRALGV